MPPTTATTLATWLKVLTEARSDLLDCPISDLFIPGTHDSASYGHGAWPTDVARFNWQCQDLNIYQQAKLGIRYFDLRLESDNTRAGSAFYPHHGDAKKTGDVLSKSPTTAGGMNTILGQLAQFVKENPSELIILGLDITPTTNTYLTDILRNCLGESAFVEAPDWATSVNNPITSTPRMPTLREIRAKGRNFIITGNMPLDLSSLPQRLFVEQYVWKCPGAGFFESLYNEPIWKSNDPAKVKKAIDDWMDAHSSDLAPRKHLFNTQCQLTPSANDVWDVIKSVANPGITTSPRHLARVMNPYVRGSLTKDAKWREYVNVMTVDFADADTVLAIVDMNFTA